VRKHGSADEEFKPRARSTRRSLASVVLAFELVIVFLGGLTIFGLNAINPRELGIVIGVGLALLMIIALALMRTSLGLPLGWAAQVGMLATGFLVTALFVVGALFFGLWIYCMVVGGRMDRDRVATQQDMPEHPGESVA
jgi:hypothetical protein